MKYFRIICRTRAIHYEPLIFERLFEEKPSVSTQTKLKMLDIIDPLLDAGIDTKFIKESRLKLPSELFYKNFKTIGKAIEKAQKMKMDITPHLGSSTSAIKRTKKKEIKEKHEAEANKKQHILIIWVVILIR